MGRRTVTPSVGRRAVQRESTREKKRQISSSSDKMPGTNRIGGRGEEATILLRHTGSELQLLLILLYILLLILYI